MDILSTKAIVNSLPSTEIIG